MSGLKWLAAAAIAALLATGCSGGEPAAAPPPGPTRSTTPVATQSPTPQPPSLPAAARKNSKAGAVAFAHHYIELVNFASRTGNVTALRRASARSCASCQNMLTILDDVYGHGGSVEGGRWRVDSYSAAAAGPTSTWLIAMNLSAAPQVVRRTAPGEIEKRSGGKFSASLYARWSGTDWVTRRLVRDQ